MEKRLIKISEAAKLLGTSVGNLRKWEASGELLPARKTKGGARYSDVSEILNLDSSETPTICYARVSSREQKEDLERQQIMLESYCSAKGWRSKTIKDVGSGMNYKKKGLHQLLEMILQKKVKRLMITHKDRLFRFGSVLVFALYELQNIEIVIIHRGDLPSYEEELTKDVLEIITVFSARLYESISHKNKKLIDSLKDVVASKCSKYVESLNPKI